MNGIRLRRLNRAYRTIAKTEVKLQGHPEASRLRLLFAEQTVAAIDRRWKQLGYRRPERRRMKRRLMGARAA